MTLWWMSACIRTNRDYTWPDTQLIVQDLLHQGEIHVDWTAGMQLCSWNDVYIVRS